MKGDRLETVFMGSEREKVVLLWKKGYNASAVSIGGTDFHQFLAMDGIRR